MLRPLMLLSIFATLVFTSSQPLASPKPTILVSLAHKEVPVRPQFRKIAKEINSTLVEHTSAITPESLKGVSLLYINAPKQTFAASEKNAIINYLNQGGALLLTQDEERRQSLAKTEVNDLIIPFAMMLTQDTPYIHNTGALAVSGNIHAADREIPFSGGRAVVGGTPFAFQIDKNGNAGLPFASYKSLKSGGRIIVMGDIMAHIYMGEKNAERMSGVHRNPKKTTYWGKDSYIFMQEVFTWLINTH